MSDQCTFGFPQPGDDSMAWMDGAGRHAEGPLAVEKSFRAPYTDDYDYFNDQRFYSTMHTGQALQGGLAPGLNQLVATPIMFDRDVVVDRFSINASAAVAGGPKFIFGIYEADRDLDNMWPGSLVGITPVLTAAGSRVNTVYTCVPLRANTLYWVAYSADSTAVANAAFMAMNAANPLGFYEIGGIDTAMGTVGGCWITVSYTFASNLPSYFPNGASIYAVPTTALIAVGLGISS